MRIGLDIDGVLRDFTESLRVQYRKDYPEHVIKEVTEWDVWKFYPIGKEITNYMYHIRGKEVFQFGFAFSEALPFVSKLKASGHEIHIITYQPPGTEGYTLNWIRNFGFVYDGINFEKNKAVIDCDIYLDDAVHNCEELKQAGKRAVCFDQPWNQAWEGERVKTYAEFLELVGIRK